VVDIIWPPREFPWGSHPEVRAVLPLDIVFVARDARRRAMIGAAIPAALNASAVDERELVNRIRAGRVMLALLDEDAELGWVEAKLAGLQDATGDLPAIIVLQRHNHGTVLAIPSHSVVFVSGREKLWPAIQLAAVDRVAKRAALAGAHHYRFPSPVRKAIRGALIIEPPFGSVRSLSEWLEVPARTLFHYWASTTFGRADVSMANVLDWIGLVKAVSRKRANQGWAATLDGWEITPARLRRIALRLTGHTLQDLVDRESLELLAEFDRQLGGRLRERRSGCLSSRSRLDVNVRWRTSRPFAKPSDLRAIAMGT
jgi:hypothetical protein